MRLTGATDSVCASLTVPTVDSRPCDPPQQNAQVPNYVTQEETARQGWIKPMFLKKEFF